MLAPAAISTDLKGLAGAREACKFIKEAPTFEDVQGFMDPAEERKSVLVEFQKRKLQEDALKEPAKANVKPPEKKSEAIDTLYDAASAPAAANGQINVAINAGQTFDRIQALAKRGVIPDRVNDFTDRRARALDLPGYLKKIEDDNGLKFERIDKDLVMEDERVVGEEAYLTPVSRALEFDGIPDHAFDPVTGLLMWKDQIYCVGTKNNANKFRASVRKIAKTSTEVILEPQQIGKESVPGGAAQAITQAGMVGASKEGLRDLLTKTFPKRG